MLFALAVAFVLFITAKRTDFTGDVKISVFTFVAEGRMSVDNLAAKLTAVCKKYV